MKTRLEMVQKQLCDSSCIKETKQKTCSIGRFVLPKFYAFSFLMRTTKKNAAFEAFGFAEKFISGEKMQLSPKKSTMATMVLQKLNCYTAV